MTRSRILDANDIEVACIANSQFFKKTIFKPELPNG